MTTKTCSACHQEKPIAAFHHFGKDHATVGKWCEVCYQETKAKRAARPRPSVERTRSTRIR
jgi:hypothetical protein